MGGIKSTNFYEEIKFYQHCPVSDDRFLVTKFPAVEKRCSLEIEVPGVHKYFLARRASLGYTLTRSFHQHNKSKLFPGNISRLQNSDQFHFLSDLLLI